MAKFSLTIINNHSCSFHLVHRRQTYPRRIMSWIENIMAQLKWYSKNFMSLKYFVLLIFVDIYSFAIQRKIKISMTNISEVCWDFVLKMEKLINTVIIRYMWIWNNTLLYDGCCHVVLICNMNGFVLKNFDGVKGSMVHLENPEWQTRWYFKYFLGRCKFTYNFWFILVNENIENNWSCCIL